MQRIGMGFIAVLFLLCTCDPAPSISQTPADRLNHLADQKSPYLLQHARNPVDWYPWGEAALSRATAEDKLLVISVGYAACHWCHVMERESFEDSLVAAVMNEHFVSIKVDREERPDVDEVYMTACQLTAGQGCGWPLNVIALPDGRPVWAGTYFPKDQWLKLLRRFADLRLSEPGKMVEYAAGLTEELTRQNSFSMASSDGEALTAAPISAAAETLLATIDWKYGGTEGSPKFPMPVLYEFLLAHHFHSGDSRSLEAVTTTLDAMADGGIYDQLAGGFSRYSTDEHWLVPHFEKMLYDNAQLLSLYAHAYQLTGGERYARVVRQTISFLDNTLSDPGGIFYASLDADTDGEEGSTYVWTRQEIEAALPDERRQKAFLQMYGVTGGGNWEGKNILHRKAGPEKLATGPEYPSATELEADLEAARRKLLQVRDTRPQPALDDKGITAWNALAISGYAAAYRALGDEQYRERARRTAEFLNRNAREDDGRLYRNYKDGGAAINGFLDDYALLAQAYVDLYQITFEEVWLGRAGKLVTYANAHFFDVDAGLYRYTSDLDPPLVTVNVPVNDRVIPGGNSVMARVLHQLGTLTADEDMVTRSRDMLERVRARLAAEGPRFLANWALLYLELLHPTYEVAIMGENAGAVRDTMSNEYLPNALLLGGRDEGTLELLTHKLNPGETTIYVCLQKVCQLPVTETGAALRQMNR